MEELKCMRKRIKEEKKKKGYTNESLAQEAEISVSTLSKVLAGIIKEPPITTIIKIAKALDVSADYLVFGKENTDNFSSHEISVLNKYRKLNSKGKPKAETYIDDLLVNPQYTVQDTPSLSELKLVAENKNSVPPIVDDITHT